jgi:hypothetical protein
VRRRVSPSFGPFPAYDDVAIEGWAKTRKRQQAARARMAVVDSMPKDIRAVLNGLPRPDWLLPAIEAGCETQDDAEEWVRSVVGRTVLG